MSLLKNGRSEEKEVDVVLGEVACSKIEGPPFLCKVRATNHCATSPSIASPHAMVKQFVPKMKDHLLCVRFALLANVQLL